MQASRLQAWNWQARCLPHPLRMHIAYADVKKKTRDALFMNGAETQAPPEGGTTNLTGRPAEPTIRSVEGTIPEGLTMMGHARSVSAVLCAAVFGAICPGLRAGEKVSPTAQAFIQALSAPDSTEESRRAAWRELQGTGKAIPQAAVDAVDKARQRAWKTMGEYVREARAGGLSAAVTANKPKVFEALNSKGRTGGLGGLDLAMAPMEKALDEARSGLGALPKFGADRRYLFDMEVYAGKTPLRFGWSDDLGDTLINEMIVSRALATAGGLQTIANNLRTGAAIDPEEFACLVRLNTHRLLVGVEPVEIDLRLVVAAKKHSEEMVAKNYCSDESPTATLKDPSSRAAREQTSCTEELVTSGAMSGLGAFKSWYYSLAQHKIMLSDATAAGVGRCGTKWTLMLGSAKAGAGAAKMAQYVRDRYRAGKDLAAIVDLAKWCATSRLPLQAEDELQRVLEIDPKNAAAKKALEDLHAKAKKGR